MQPVKVLSIGGSDPCGAFGVQADLRTFARLGAWGMGVITAVTAQNSLGFYGVEFVSAALLGQQLEAVLSDYTPVAVKTGFLGRVDLIEMVATKLAAYQIKHIVIDPVLVDGAGRLMFDASVTAAYRNQLLPLASVATPKLAEATLLTRAGTAEAGAQALVAMGCGAAIVTGVQEGSEMVDWLLDEHGLAALRSPYVATRNVGGSGDLFSAVLAVVLAQGEPLAAAFAKAKAVTHGAIQAGQFWQLAKGAGAVGIAELN